MNSTVLSCLRDRVNFVKNDILKVKSKCRLIFYNPFKSLNEVK